VNPRLLAEGLASKSLAVSPCLQREDFMGEKSVGAKLALPSYRRYMGKKQREHTPIASPELKSARERRLAVNFSAITPPLALAACFPNFSEAGSGTDANWLRVSNPLCDGRGPLGISVANSSSQHRRIQAMP